MILTNIELQNTGGHCMVLYIEVEGIKGIKTIGLNDECICLFEDVLSEVESGEAMEHSVIFMCLGKPFKDLGEIIGKRNSEIIKAIYEDKYNF